MPEDAIGLIEGLHDEVDPDLKLKGEKLTREANRLKTNIQETIGGLPGYKDALVGQSFANVSNGGSASITRFTESGMDLELKIDNGREIMGGNNSSDRGIIELIVYSPDDPKIILNHVKVSTPNKKASITGFEGGFGYSPKDEPTEGDTATENAGKPFDNTMRASKQITALLNEIKTKASIEPLT